LPFMQRVESYPAIYPFFCKDEQEELTGSASFRPTLRRLPPPTGVNQERDKEDAVIYLSI
jgi:hypothetical protein